MKRPSTMPEWEAYVGSMGGSTLYKQAISANTQTFINTLLDEGYSIDEVKQILVFFARQLKATDTMVPTDGAYDLDYIAADDPVAAAGMTMSGEEADRLDVEPNIPDQIDEFDLTEDWG